MRQRVNSHFVLQNILQSKRNNSKKKKDLKPAHENRYKHFGISRKYVTTFQNTRTAKWHKCGHFTFIYILANAAEKFIFDYHLKLRFLPPL